MHPLIAGVLKVGTTGAGIMAGTTIVVEGAKRVAAFVDEKVLHPMLDVEIEPIIAGPLDMVGTLLDPLDLTGTRARKERKEKEAKAAAKRKAKREAAAKKKAQKAAAEAEQRATAAEEQARILEEQARAAEARAQTAEANAKRVKATKMRRWSGMARATANSARQQVATDPGASEKVALAALDLAKAAINPPASPQGVLNDPNMPAEQKSLLVDIIDELNRFGAPPAIEPLLARMWAGAGSAAMAMQDVVYDDDDEVDGVVSGGEKDGDDVAEKSLVQELLDDPDHPYPAEPGAGPTVAGGEEPIVEGCCSSCAMGDSCGGEAKAVAGSLLDGSIVDGGDDDDDEDGEVGGMFGFGSQSEEIGEELEDDLEVGGREGASLFGFPVHAQKSRKAE